MKDMPKLIYGTAWKKEHTANLVEMALILGLRGVDTACQPKHYEEALVGEGIKRAIEKGVVIRDELFVQTKFTPLGGQDPNRLPYDPKLPLKAQIRSSFEASKRNLGVEYIDSLVLHSPIFPYPALLEAWSVFEELCKSAEVGIIGISNCYEEELFGRLFADASVKPSVLQNRFYEASDYDKGLRAFCDKNGVTYQSFWSLTANPHILGSEAITSLTQKYQKTAAQIFYRYLTQIGIVPLIGSTSESHLREDLEIFGFALASDEILTVDALL